MMMVLVLGTVSYFNFSNTVFAAALVCEKQMSVVSKKYDVPLGILYAIGLTETGYKKTLNPFALNIAGKSFFPKTENEAMQKFNEARSRGETQIDMGCMQINHYYHSGKFKSARQMLNPQKNVEYAALFLKALYKREGSWTLAAARYHAGPNNLVAQKRYVCVVIRNMIASGFGEWTEKAKIFCK